MAKTPKIPRTTTTLEVLAMLARLHADPGTRGRLNSGDALMQAAAQELISWDDAGLASLGDAIDQLASEGAITFKDFGPNKRRQGEPLSASRLSSCIQFKITLQGHASIRELGLLENAKAKTGVAAESDSTPALPTPAAKPGRRRAKYWHKSGERLGRRWTVTSIQLGHGGNSEVWEAEDEDTGERVALKIFHPQETDARRYLRFRREVDAVQQLAESGRAVLPIIDYELPENLEEGTAWFTMPIARNLRVALQDAPVTEIVRAIAQLGHELAGLAELGTHHRDVKPENLYEHGGRYLLGDFGLVKRLEDEDLTRPEERLPGPGHYLPNEAILRWEDADPEAIDLVCLAKTLWALLMREPRPIVGQFRAGGYYSLSKKLERERYVDELEAVLERATSDDPEERGTLRRFARELEAWLDNRKLRQGMLAEGARDDEVEARVRQWVVRFARTDPEFGYHMINVGVDEDSPLEGVTSPELSDALQRLFDRGEIAVQRDERPEPRFWWNLHPRAWLIDEVEGRDAVRAELVPVLRTLRRERPDLLQLNQGVELELGGVQYPAPFVVFALRYWIESGFVEAREEPEGGGGLLFLNVRVTAPGDEYLRQLAGASGAAGGRPTVPDVTRALARATGSIALDDFITMSRGRFNLLGSERLAGEAPSRYQHGLLEIAYTIDSLGKLALPQLKEMLAQAQLPIDWPMWAVHPERDLAPEIREGTIECFLANPHGGSPQHSDFWRAAPSLLLYLVRGHAEDGFEQVEPATALDIGEPIWNAGEALLHAHRLAQLVGEDEATVQLRVRWTGLINRQLRSMMPRRRLLNDDRVTRESVIETHALTRADEIPEQLVDLVRELTMPLYVTFNFFEPPDNVFQEELAELRQMSAR